MRNDMNARWSIRLAESWPLGESHLPRGNQDTEQRGARPRGMPRMVIEAMNPGPDTAKKEAASKTTLRNSNNHEHCKISETLPSTARAGNQTQRQKNNSSPWTRRPIQNKIAAAVFSDGGQSRRPHPKGGRPAGQGSSCRRSARLKRGPEDPHLEGCGRPMPFVAVGGDRLGRAGPPLRSCGGGGQGAERKANHATQVLR